MGGGRKALNYVLSSQDEIKFPVRSGFVNERGDFSKASIHRLFDYAMSTELGFNFKNRSHWEDSAGQAASMERRKILGYYKGIFPPILAETPKRAVKFFTFEQYKKILNYTSLPSNLIFTIAGLGSGLTETIVVNPFEVVKVSLQAQRNAFSEQLSTFAYAREIVRSQGFGLQGLNKGLTATLGRHGVFNMIYFGFYFNVKNIIPAEEDPVLEFLRKVGIGLLSGTIASCVNIPFDVAKSRIQGPQPILGEIKYRTCFSTMNTIYREEGFFALYKGLVPKIMRLGPGGAVMLLVYEYSLAWLHENY